MIEVVEKLRKTRWAEIVQDYKYPITYEADLAAREHPGDFLEIGIGHGEHAADLLRVAERYYRVMVGIDPFEKIWDGSNQHESYLKPYTKERAREVMEHPYFVHHEEDSHHPSSKIISNRPLAFAHVDGDQSSVQTVLDDLYMVIHAHVIAVDDYDRHDTVKRAVQTFIQPIGREILEIDRWAIIKRVST